MSREPIKTWYYALIVVRKGDQFLIVQERKHDQTWYLPAGGVEKGETFQQAARRECLEESGIQVRLTDIIRLEHSPKRQGTRMRVIYLAEPVDDTPLKTVPDQESLGARWVTLDELHNFPLRAAEVEQLFAAVANGCPLFPLEMIQHPYFSVNA